MMSSAENGRLRSPIFTANQWQEFEHQALIFKYMVSGVPIPSELLFPVKRSLDSRLYQHQQSPIGWGCFQVGFGRKQDPEPGRCRRTDGKKWRCSKEAYPDSKYCERHMHRGRNRSRKPVESSINNSTATAAATTSTTASNIPTTLLSINNKSSTTTSYNSTNYSSSSLEPADHILTNPNPFMYSHAGKDYGYFHGMKEVMNERDFFTDSSGSLRSIQDSYQQLRMSTSSYSGSSTNTYKGYQQQQPQFNMSSYATSSADHHASNQQQQQQQHCYILGADFKSTPETKSIKLEKDSDHSHRPLHHFFSEWPPKSTECWLDLSSSSRSNTDS